MKKVKQIIGTTLTASLATGVAGTIAGTVASAATIDELYKAAYEATLNALTNKDQDSINAARVAIDRIPAQFQGFKGEFSKQVDTVQHPILVKIVNAINNADKTGKQADINAARLTIPAGLPDVWKNSYSSGLDGVQQKLITKAVTAAEKAKTSGAKADIDAAKALINELALVEQNQGVKDWVTTYDKDFATNIPLTIDDVDVTASNTIKVNFLKEVDAATVKTSAFSAYTTADKTKLTILSTTLSQDKKSVEVKFGENVTAAKDYTLEVKDIKSVDGKTMKSTSLPFQYESAEVQSITLTKQTIKIAEDLRKSVVVKDSLGRDITDDSTVTFESSNVAVITNNGIAKIEGEATITPVIKDSKGNVVLKGEKTLVKVSNVAATEYQGYSVYTLKALEGGGFETKESKTGNTYSKFDVSVDVKLKDTNTNKIAFFFRDQYGNELKASESPTTIEVLENQSLGVATLASDGTITTVGVGTAYFKVKVGDVTKTISINVTAEAAPTTLTLNKTSVIAGAAKEAQDIKVSLKDQYGDKYSTGTLTLQVLNPSGVYINAGHADVAANPTIYPSVGTVSALSNGEATITVTPTATGETGKNTYRLVYERKDADGKVLNTITKDFTTEVKTPGTATGSKFETTAITSLDLYNDPVKIGDETADTFKVYNLDADGIRIDKMAGAVVTVNDDKGATVEVKTTAAKTPATKFIVDEAAGVYTMKTVAGQTATGTYTVSVKSATGTLISSYTLTVTDSTRTAQTATFNSTGLTATNITGNILNLKGIVSLTDQFGKGIVLDQTTALEKVQVDLTDATQATVLKEVPGVSKDILIKKITVDFDATAGKLNATAKDATITLPTPIVVTVVQ